MGCSPVRGPSLVMTSMVQIEDQVFEQFRKATVMLDLIPFPATKDTENNSGHSKEGELIGKPV